MRELRNAVERASLMCDSDIILPEHLSDDAEDGEIVRSGADVSPQSLLEIERRALLDAAASHRGTRKAFADKLGSVALPLSPPCGGAGVGGTIGSAFGRCINPAPAPILRDAVSTGSIS